jgi:hypothetical protein
VIKTTKDEGSEGAYRKERSPENRKVKQIKGSSVGRKF